MIWPRFDHSYMTVLATIPSPEDIAADTGEQQELFGARVFAPEDVELIRGARRYAHTGTTAVRDEQRARSICAAKLMGWSNRKVAREMHCDIRTVGLVVEIMERAGKLPALKERLMRRVGEAAEVTVERLNEMLESGESLDPELAGMIKSLWVGAGIGADKLAAPGPAAVHLHQHLHQAGGMDAAREYAAMLAAAKGAPVDSESTDLVTVGAGSAADVVTVEAAATSEPGRTPTRTGIGIGSGSASQAGLDAAPPGGGVADSAPGGRDDGFQRGTS